MQTALEELRARRRSEQEASQREARKPHIISDLTQLLQAEYGLSPEDVQLAVRNAVYNIYPNAPGIPQDFKLQVLERKMQMEQQRQQEQSFAQQKAHYQAQLSQFAHTASEADFPVSLDWYDGNKGAYVSALEQTALAMSEEATRQGLAWIDLSPKAVQQKHEADLVARFTKAQERKAARQPKVETPKPADSVSKVPADAPVEKAAAAVSTSSPRLSREEMEARSDALIKAFMGQ